MADYICKNCGVDTWDSGYTLPQGSTLCNECWDKSSEGDKQMANKDEAVLAFCELITKVGTEVFGDEVPHDCICGALVLPGAKIDNSIIEFIKDAVNKAIKNQSEEYST